MTATDATSSGFGTNSWLVDEMFAKFVSDPSSVGEAWREFFSDYKPMIAPAPAAANAAASTNGAASAPSPATQPVSAPSPAAPPVADVGEPIRGAGVAIAANMERSLSVPTATSFRNVPAKLLEVNRKVINGYRSRSGQGKVSFTHLI
jgi:multifunctional 2-oxoglutarate metabolism enzyme